MPGSAMPAMPGSAMPGSAGILPACTSDDEHLGAARSVAVCPECAYEHPFLRLPLLVVTGASGTGKSTVLLKLAGIAHDFVCLDSDILWRDEFNKPDDDYMDYRNVWLRMVKNIAQSGRPVVLFGSSTPGQFERCHERRYIGDIKYLALTCSDLELERRLKARPNWRNSGSDETIVRMKQFNKWLGENAADCGMHVIDTTPLTVEESANATLQWMRSHDSIRASVGRK